MEEPFAARPRRSGSSGAVFTNSRYWLRICSGLVERKNDQACDDFRAHGEKSEFELGDDAKISSAAANRPEKIRIFVFTCAVVSYLRP